MIRVSVKKYMSPNRTDYTDNVNIKIVTIYFNNILKNYETSYPKTYQRPWETI